MPLSYTQFNGFIKIGNKTENSTHPFNLHNNMTIPISIKCNKGKCK